MLTINALSGNVEAPILWNENATAKNRNLQVLPQNYAIHGGTAGPAVSINVIGSSSAATTTFVAKVLELSSTASISPAVNLYRRGANGQSLSPSASEANAPAAGGAGQTFATFDAKSTPGELSISSAGDGIWIGHLGGTGGSGTRSGGKSGTGGSGGPISIVTKTKTVIESQGIGIVLQSLGGASTNGPGGNGFRGGGDGGKGGDGGDIFVNGDANGASTVTGGSWSIETFEDNSGGLEIESIASNGSEGGLPSGGNGGDGGDGGDGGTVTVFDAAPITVTTHGDSAVGIVAVSEAGSGGKGKDGSVTGLPGDGGIGGEGGEVTITGKFDVTTLGYNSDGITASSAGGAGATGGTGQYGGGGVSGDGGRAAIVSVNIGAGSNVATTGDQSTGIAVQSIGGRGGSGTSTKGVLSFGASGGSAGYSGAVEIENAGSVQTDGIGSHALLAQSVGGGGGSGGTSFGAFYSSGSGGSYGGNGGTVTVNNSGTLTTKNHASSAIEAQSIGGSGGSGGSSGGIVSIGGGSAQGGEGGTVTVTNSGDISTGSLSSSTSDEDAACSVGCSYGLIAQSIGGGGGNGGSSGGWFSLGANGGSGGSGGSVSVSNSDGASIYTELDSSSAILAHSIGGGGGNGRASISAGLIASASIGGSGGVGGNGGTVDVSLGEFTAIETVGKLSHGVQAQSVGGGGGNGGYSVAVAVSAFTPAISVSVGGAGGAAGHGKAVTVTSTADSSDNSSIQTQGDDSHGVFAQSIGGGGGHGGFAVSAAATGASLVGGISVGVGGKGGSGNTGGDVAVTSTGVVSTEGHRSAGLLAQSLGGSGGNGGFAVSGSMTIQGNGAAIGVGGTGGTGGASNAITVTSSSMIDTLGAQSPGISAQSIGGGRWHRRA